MKEVDMRIDFRFWGFAGAVFALIGLGQMVACTTDDNDSPGQGGAGGASGGSSTSPIATGGAAGTGAGGSSVESAGLACAKAILLDGTKPGIANFDSYDGSVVSKWLFSLGDDSSTGIWAGPFGYGDREGTETVETFDMTDGHNSLYALRVKDTNAQKYGGGMGIWMSGCLDATKFTGVSFWVRGVAPTGTAKLSLMIKETTATTPLKAEYKTGTCPGVTDSTCIPPKYEFEVKDTWALIQIPWTAFSPGVVPGGEVRPDGSNIWQLQFDIGLQWVKDATDTWVPVPGAYELVVDDMAFY
jgi:hypothetical protein